MTFDITMAFDKAEYLNPQLYLFFSTLSNHLNEDSGCTLHIVTNRNEDDELLEWIRYTMGYINVKEYYNDGYKTNHLKSRCKYMLNCFDIEPENEWVIKMEADMLILKNLERFNLLFKPENYEPDLVLEPENRKIFIEEYADYVWPRIYRAMKIKYPDMSKHMITYREKQEIGYPLFGTGIVCVKSKLLPKINRQWIDLTHKCEPWIDMNIHPNEFAFTAMVLNEGWKWYTYPDKYKYNPIGHWRNGMFPSQELIENSKLPDDTIIFDYHRPQWLMHVSKRNAIISQIIQDNRKYIPREWWGTSPKTFQEKI